MEQTEVNLVETSVKHTCEFAHLGSKLDLTADSGIAHPS
jgi:hypothetical protein